LFLSNLGYPRYQVQTHFTVFVLLLAESVVHTLDSQLSYFKTCLQKPSDITNSLKNLRGILVSTRSSIEILTVARKALISAVPAVPAVPANRHITAKTFSRPTLYILATRRKGLKGQQLGILLPLLGSHFA
jgi:hypothetical protein